MTTQADAIPLALIGYGLSGQVFHGPFLKATPGLDVAVVGSRNPERVRVDFPAARVVADPMAAATHPEVELVVIASPNETHRPLAAAALRAGKHVVVDKPFTLNLAEARELAALARTQQRLLSVYHNRRWDSDFLGLQAVIAGGRLGEVVHFESHFNRYRPIVQVRWREQPGPGAGQWYDLGPHLIDQALQLFGLPAAVTATLLPQRATGQTVDWAHVLLDYGRRRVILHISMLVAGGMPRYVVHGTAGSWIKYGMDTQEELLRAGRMPGGPGWGEDPRPATFYDGATGATLQMPTPPGDYLQYYLRIRDAIRQNAPNPVTPAQAVAVMAVLETAMESAACGKTLALPRLEDL
jgi:predicted dehydrogenase